MNNDIAVKLKNVSKYYKLYNYPKDRLKEALHPFKKKFHKKFYAIKTLNLEIKKGEILGLVGKNGAGKSTLLKIISGIIQPSSGKVIVNGKVSALLELGSGLNPEFTGIQNIHFSCTMMDLNKEEMKEKERNIIIFADIGDFIYQPLKTYSSGMNARLAFSIAVNVDPEILIVDEVLAVGDELFSRKCYAKMEAFVEQGKTIIFVSHSAHSVNQLCTRAILIDTGTVLLEGPAKMVTMYYQKMLYSKKQNYYKIFKEIKNLNEDEEKKKTFYTKENNTLKKDNVTLQKEVEIIKQEFKLQPFYISDFKPKSTVEYKNYDVDILEICLTTLDGKEVNHLVNNEIYKYKLRIEFNIKAENVVFGFRIKDEKGMHIAGFSCQDKNAVIEKIEKSDVYLLNYTFKCSLLNGIYYTNNGVASIINGEIVYLNRLVDGTVFKVIQDDVEKGHTGIVSLDLNLMIEKKQKIAKMESVEGN